MSLAADVLFGEAASELKSRDIAGEAAQREHLMHTMFNDDWMKVSGEKRSWQSLFVAIFFIIFFFFPSHERISILF